MTCRHWQATADSQSFFCWHTDWFRLRFLLAQCCSRCTLGIKLTAATFEPFKCVLHCLKNHHQLPCLNRSSVFCIASTFEPFECVLRCLKNRRQQVNMQTIGFSRHVVAGWVKKKKKKRKKKLFATDSPVERIVLHLPNVSPAVASLFRLRMPEIQSSINSSIVIRFDYRYTSHQNHLPLCAHVCVCTC